MKYISFIDQLGIDINQLADIDANGIIKLQKQLKAKAMLGDANNLGEVANLIEKLKDETTRRHHIFVEKHVWLKQLISGDYKSIKQGEVTIDNSQIEDLEDLKYFLAPFLKENLKVFLSESLSKGKYVLILKVLIQNRLFSEENNQLVINFFKARLNYATVYLRENRLKGKEYPIAFITNKVFINCLNEYPNCFNDDIQELNSEVIDVYNSKRKNIDNKEFRFAAKAMVAFSILDTSNVFLEETLRSNASIAREYTYPSRSSRKTGSGYGAWTVFVIIMIVLRIIFWAAKSNNSTPNFSNFPSSNGGINWMGDLGKNNIIELNNIRSVYPKLSESKPVVPISHNLYDNPYHPKFHKFYPPKSKSDISKFDTYVTNKTGKDLIMFMLYKNNDKSVYIPDGEQAPLQISAKDTIIFYSGNDFVSFSKSSRFFKKEAHMSSLYIIDSISFTKEHFIDVYPARTREIPAGTATIKQKMDSIVLKNVFYKNIGLNAARNKAFIDAMRSN
ncbi:hypothetical protein [uncultured Psychroserpens sp.]|uniref:hypothetical protein n=1 Tax=uncultured Psychroserpens sp. TaxID=255436 RepID=UPI002615C45F|nr:hypothetical protein [uncultured Psychroserpens sp.]